MTTAVLDQDIDVGAGDIRRTLELLVVPGGVVDIRALHVPTNRAKPITVAGYFTDLDKAAAAAAQLDARKAAGVYIVLNEIIPAVFARSPNMLTDGLTTTTSDADIVRRVWLPLDFDPVRPTGISATEDEHCEAEDAARKCSTWLSSLDWPSPIIGDSGNGAHLLYRIDLPADDGGLVQQVLAAIADQIDNDDVKVDRVVYNPSRIWKAYGTRARKGHDLPDRPHRTAQLIDVPKHIEEVPVELLRAMAATRKTEPAKSNGSGVPFDNRLDVPAWLSARGVAFKVKDRPDSHGRTVYLLEECPFDPNHNGSEVAIFQAPSNKLGAACKHNSCAGRGWQQFKERIGPPAPEHWNPPLGDHRGNGHAGYQVTENNAKSIRELPDIEDACAFCAREIPMPPELVQGLLHQGSKLQFGGSSKGYTTWTLDYLALAVAYGLPWLGFETRQAKVLLVDLELQPAFCQSRIKRLTEVLGITQESGRLDVWNLRGYAAGHREIFPRILARIGGRNYGLVVLDPIYKLYGVGTDENSARDVADLLNSMELLTVETGAAAAYRSHYSKGNQSGKSAIDRVSGSGVFARDPDALLNLTAHAENEQCYTLDATLRNFPPLESTVVEWRFPVFERRDDLDPAALKKATGRPPKYTGDMLLAALEDGMTSAQWERICEMSNGTYLRLRRTLESDGKVHQTNHGWHRS